jgi:integrase
MRLTTATVEGLRLDTDVTDKIFFDEDIAGFGIRIRTSGSRSWVFQYKLGGKTRRLVLGAVSAVKAAKAREVAAELHARVKLGHDPASEKRERVWRSRDTFDLLVEKFLAQYRRRPKTTYEVTRHLRQYAAPLHSMAVDAIALRNVADLLTRIDRDSGPALSNRVRSSLSACFTWGMREGLASHNPVLNSNKRGESARDRVLSNDEIRRIWNAAGDDAYGVVIRLLILTGQRRSEISDLRWPEIDFAKGEVTLPAERTKNKRPHIVPLSDTARALLDRLPHSGDKVLKSLNFSACKKQLDQRSGVAGWVVHDIRRSVATGMADLGIQPHVVEAVLNHQSGSRRGVAGIYNRSPYAAEKAAALARWDTHVASIVGGAR